jgi:hypothetical protein
LRLNFIAAALFAQPSPLLAALQQKKNASVNSQRRSFCYCADRRGQILQPPPELPLPQLSLGEVDANEESSLFTSVQWHLGHSFRCCASPFCSFSKWFPHLVQTYSKIGIWLLPVIFISLHMVTAPGAAVNAADKGGSLCRREQKPDAEEAPCPS